MGHAPGLAPYTVTYLLRRLLAATGLAWFRLAASFNIAASSLSKVRKKNKVQRVGSTKEHVSISVVRNRLCFQDIERGSGTSSIRRNTWQSRRLNTRC